MTTVSLNLSGGINNKARAESIPQGSKEDPRGFVRSAINVDFDNSGNFRHRIKPTLLYSGINIHSTWKRYFCENGDLKYLNLDNTSTTIKIGVGNESVSYAAFAGRVYFSNALLSGFISKGVCKKWGVTVPPFQPTATERTSGGMYKGEYQYAIAWMREGEESGAINTGRILVANDSGGLVFNNFPEPPDDVDQVAVYITPVNSETLYLYNEYPADVSEVFIDKKIGVVELSVQFGSEPPPFTIIESHYGRLYGTVDNILYFSEEINYGLFMPDNYLMFPANITILISVPGVLYVGTRDKIYRLSNIDGEGFPIITEVKEYGAVLQVNTEYDTDNTTAYFRSTKGDCVASSEGIKEITEANFAMDEFSNASLVLIESDGNKRLIGVSQGIKKATNLRASN